MRFGLRLGGSVRVRVRIRCLGFVGRHTLDLDNLSNRVKVRVRARFMARVWGEVWVKG